MVDWIDIFQILDPGRGLVLLGILFLIAAYLFRAQPKKILIIAIAIILSLFIATLLKELIPLARPCIDSGLYCPSGNSFPSRHAAMLFALAFAVWKSRLFLPYLAIAIFVVFLKVITYQHTIFDIFGGIGVAFFCMIIAEKVVDYMDKKKYLFKILKYLNS